MHDPQATFTPDGEELAVRGAELLGGLDGGLLELLDAGSRALLLATVRRAPARGVELFTQDGRVLDATVVPDEDHVVVALRDVSRYADAAANLAGMAVSLARRNRDLATLYEAATALDTSLEVADLAELTCTLVGAYLDADHVEVAVVGRTYRWPTDAGAPEAPETGASVMATARGQVGRLRWWRREPLRTNENETLPLLVSRAAIGLDHALLLSSAEDRAARDELTGLLNRAGAHRALAGLVPPYPVVLIDLDRFKAVNDAHGHAEGDRVLREVAAVLAEGRSRDVKCRWGGEEFLVALDGADLDAATRWVQERLAQVRARVQVGGRPVTFSAGIAVAGADGLDQALLAADAALYRAKASGRAQVHRADADVDLPAAP